MSKMMSKMQVLLVTWTTLLVFYHGRVSAQTYEDASNSTCQGVLMHYQVKPVTRIPPFVNDARQPYRFEALLTLTNMGFNEVKNWQAFIGFKNNEWLVSAPGTVLSDGQQLPTPVGNGTTLFGFPQTSLLNAIETAGDASKTTVAINITGTEFGVAPPNLPLPSNISLPVDGYTCGPVQQLERDTLQLCCSENKTAVNLTETERFLPLEEGDITIFYSVVQTFKDNYWAEVSISNDNPLGRIDGWNLTWEWKQGEFIKEMKGAQALEQDQSECLNGPAGVYYQNFDFSTVMSCKTTTTLVDLPIEKTNDTNVGMIPFCCRKGLLLPKIMDPAQSKSAFKLFVFKVPPHSDRDSLAPPANFDIGPRYKCGQPRLVAPVESPDPSNPLRMLSAVKSWQVTCNLTDTGTTRKVGAVTSARRTSCCVSFSAFYNSSVVPCPTCSCGCPKTSTRGCNAEAEALLIPSYGLLTPFANRTTTTLAWARINRMSVPKVLPCGDNCGVNINWHVLSDYTDGWSARISILNWGEAIPDFFTAVELGKALPGFERVFTLNGTVVSGLNNTLYIEGRKDFSDFLLGANQDNPKVPANPGKAQAVITFDKEKTPRINITGGEGFPTRVVFNGEECVLPDVLPASHGLQTLVPRGLSLLLGAIGVLLCLL